MIELYKKQRIHYPLLLYNLLKYQPFRKNLLTPIFKKLYKYLNWKSRNILVSSICITNPNTNSKYYFVMSLTDCCTMRKLAARAALLVLLTLFLSRLPVVFQLSTLEFPPAKAQTNKSLIKIAYPYIYINYIYHYLITKSPLRLHISSSFTTEHILPVQWKGFHWTYSDSRYKSSFLSYCEWIINCSVSSRYGNRWERNSRTRGTTSITNTTPAKATSNTPITHKRIPAREGPWS